MRPHEAPHGLAAQLRPALGVLGQGLRRQVVPARPARRVAVERLGHEAADPQLALVAPPEPPALAHLGPDHLRPGGPVQRGAPRPRRVRGAARVRDGAERRRARVAAQHAGPPPPHEGVEERARVRRRPGAVELDHRLVGPGAAVAAVARLRQPLGEQPAALAPAAQVAVRTHRWMPALCPCRAPARCMSQRAAAL